MMIKSHETGLFQNDVSLDSILFYLLGPLIYKLNVRRKKNSFNLTTVKYNYVECQLFDDLAKTKTKKKQTKFKFQLNLYIQELCLFT